MVKVLITGSTGKYGKHIFEILAERVGQAEKSNYFALVRDEAKAQEFKANGFGVRIGDYNNFNSLVSAMEGIDHLLFISSNDIENRLTQHQDVIKAAIQNNLNHIIYTSFVRKTEDGSSPVASIEKTHAITEKLIKESNINHTILVNGFYADMLTDFIITPQALTSGIIFFPSGEGRVNYITRKDLAEVAVNVLFDHNNHLNKVYQLYHPESYTLKDVAAFISEATGKQLSHISPEPEVFKSELEKFGLPASLVWISVAFATAIKVGEFESETTDLALVLKRTPTSLKDFLYQHYKN